MKSLESEVKKVKEHEEHYMNKVPFNPNENNNNSASTWPDSRSASCFCIEILEVTYWGLGLPTSSFD